MKNNFFTCWLCADWKPKPSHNGLPLVRGEVCDKCNDGVIAFRNKTAKAI